MGQLTPSIMLNAQVLQILRDLQDEMGDNTDINNLYGMIQKALAVFVHKAGSPLTELDPVVEGEPPSSEKMNRLWRSLTSDMSVMQKEYDYLRAAVVTTHNTITTEISKGANQNARLSNKLKTLQLYSQSTSNGIVVFGDYFRSNEFLDTTFTDSAQNAHIFGEGYVTLALQAEYENYTEDSSVRVLSTANGFEGNLHELSDEVKVIGTYRSPELDVKTNNNPETVDSASGAIVYVEEPIFKAETDPRLDLSYILDGKPDTWYEYEAIRISDNDREKANNFNFTYRRVKEDGDYEFLDWSRGPAGGEVLRLGLEFDLHDLLPINNVTYMPFGLEDNANHPVKVTSLQVSVDGTEWETILPQNVSVGTTPNLQTIRAASNITIGDAAWTFTQRRVRFVRLYIEQPNSLTRKIGHVFYVDKSGKRVERAAPDLNDPLEPYESNNVIQGDTAARREVFTAQRWAIGMRDVAIQSIRYVGESVLISKPLRVGKIVDRITLEAAVTIPKEFPQDRQWVEFYVSPDDGASWNQISRVQDDYLGIPEVIAYNDPIPQELREHGVLYVETSEPVTSLRLRVVMERPVDDPLSTPVLHNYKLKVKTR